jgi:hypothetical protein
MLYSKPSTYANCSITAKDESGNLTKVPGLLIESEIQSRRFCEGMELKKLSKQKRAMLKSDLNGFSVDQLKGICS